MLGLVGQCAAANAGGRQQARSDHEPICHGDRRHDAPGQHHRRASRGEADLIEFMKKQLYDTVSVYFPGPGIDLNAEGMNDERHPAKGADGAESGKGSG